MGLFHGCEMVPCVVDLVKFEAFQVPELLGTSPWYTIGSTTDKKLSLVVHQ